VVNWNRRELLRACLASLSRQSLTSFEILVIDNGSDDGSPELVEKFSQNSRINIHLIRNVDNKGFCAANNQGIQRARGEYVALLNNDAEADPGWLSAMVRAAEQRPDIGMIASKILVYEDPGRIDKAGHLIWLDGQNRGRGTGDMDGGQYDVQEEVLWPDGCAALYRKSMLDQIGGFDEDLFAYGDDAELGLRARIAGWRCLYAPDAVVRHHRGATLGVLSSRRLELIERNRILLAVKHFPMRLLVLNLPYFAARLGAGFWAALRGRGEAGRFRGHREKLRMAGALLRGFLAGVALIPKTWRKRRAFDPNRRLTPEQVCRLLKENQITLRALSEAAN
jgi:GT2 family glycosyltransferase